MHFLLEIGAISWKISSVICYFFMVMIKYKPIPPNCNPESFLLLRILITRRQMMPIEQTHRSTVRLCLPGGPKGLKTVYLHLLSPPQSSPHVQLLDCGLVEMNLINQINQQRLL